jgi:hypothetical protein
MLLLNRARAVTFSAMAFASGLTWMPDVSFARDGWGGFAAGVIAGGIMRGFPGGGGGGGGGRHRGGGGGGDQSNNDGGGTPAKKEQVAQNAVLEWAARKNSDNNDNIESMRNVAAAIQDFIAELKKRHQKLAEDTARSRGTPRNDINQITEGEIRLSVEKAYQESHLTDFEALAGEIWTRDRLQVQILLEAQKGIVPYFNGVGAKGPDLNNLQDVFKESAIIVYGRALELAEIVGVGRSFDHFIRTIYENSDQAPVGLQTVGADLQYEHMVTRVINDVDRDFFAIERLDNQKTATLSARLSQQFSFRFRSRRALYDCIAANYVSLVTDGSVQQAQYSKGQGQNGLLASGTIRRGNVITVADSSDSTEEVMKRTRAFVGKTCKEMTRPVAQNAVATGLHPIPARTDLAVNAGMAVNRSEGQYLQIRTGE